MGFVPPLSEPHAVNRVITITAESNKSIVFLSILPLPPLIFIYISKPERLWYLI
jgi:hypothetical protein